MTDAPSAGWAARLRSPLGFGVIALVLVAVVVGARWRGGGEAGAAYGAAETADCVAVHPDGLTQVDWAFDGVVTGTGPSVSDRPGAEPGYVGVTFDVREWFDGGAGQEVTVDLQSRPSPGTRLLVAGTARWGGDPLADPVSWQACGFVRYFAPELADDWRARLAS